MAMHFNIVLRVASEVTELELTLVTDTDDVVAAVPKRNKCLLYHNIQLIEYILNTSI